MGPPITTALVLACTVGYPAPESGSIGPSVAGPATRQHAASNAVRESCSGVMDFMHANHEVDPQSILDLIDSMMDAPRLVPIAERRELKRAILVISHAEVWKWRIVLRFALGSREAPIPLTLPIVAGDHRDGTGIVFATVVDSRDRKHETHRWMSEWSVHDDVGTDYRLVSGSGGGNGGDWWQDLSVQVEPAPPPSASRLTFNGPEDVTASVELGGDTPAG